MAGGFDGAWKGLERAINQLKAFDKKSQAAMTRTHYRIGATVKDVAQDYAPISPTQQGMDKALKAAGGKKRPSRRKPRATSRPKPGTLQSQITFKATPQFAKVWVPSSGPAGLYAFRIHEEKGFSWWNRGLGTKAKGPQADEKFIIRATQDSEGDLIKIVLDEQKKAESALK